MMPHNSAEEFTVHTTIQSRVFCYYPIVVSRNETQFLVIYHLWKTSGSKAYYTEDQLSLNIKQSLGNLT